MTFIADMSEFQPENVDFNQLKGQVDLAILRDQFGYTKKDSKYDSFVAGCLAVGLPFDTYAFFDAVSVSDAVAEADSDIQRMAKQSVVAWIDIETVSVKSGKDTDLQAAYDAYYDELKKAGFQKVGMYSGEYFYNQHGLANCKHDCLWIAKYNANDGTLDLSKRPAVACDLWQFTSVGKLNGVTGNIDLSVLVGDKPLSYFTGKALPFIGCLDTPAHDDKLGGVISCKGWFLHESGITSVQILVDGQVVALYIYGGEKRSDVLAAYPDYKEESAGFSVDVDFSKLTPGAHKITAIGYPKNGGDGLKLQEISIEVVAAPVAPPADVAPMTPEVGPVPTEAPAPVEPPTPKRYNVVIPNLRGFSLGAVHEYISYKGWGYTANENKDGTLSLEIGIFREGSKVLEEFESYLDTEKYTYSLKEVTV